MNFLRAAAAIMVLLAAPAMGQDVGGNSTANVTTQNVGGDQGGFIGATVTTAVNIRNQPDSRNSVVIGTLQQGGTVMVRCSFGWCELSDGGFVAQKFLDFSGGSFEALPPPDNGETTGGQPSIADTTPAPVEVPDFAGKWTVLDAAGQPQRLLTLVQEGTAVSGTLEAPSRTAKITGQIGGKRLDFTYQMLNEKNEQVASGTGTLDMGEDGRSLFGRLMLNGLVLGDIDARRQ